MTIPSSLANSANLPVIFIVRPTSQKEILQTCWFHANDNLPITAAQSSTVNTASKTVILSNPLPIIQRSVRSPVPKFKTACEQFATPKTSRAVTSKGTSPCAVPVEKSFEGRMMAYRRIRARSAREVFMPPRYAMMSWCQASPSASLRTIASLLVLRLESLRIIRGWRKQKWRNALGSESDMYDIWYKMLSMGCDDGDIAYLENQSYTGE